MSVEVRMTVNDLNSLSTLMSSKTSISIHCFVMVALKVKFCNREVKSLPSEKQKMESCHKELEHTVLKQASIAALVGETQLL